MEELDLAPTLYQMLLIASVSEIKGGALAEMFAHVWPQDDELCVYNRLLLCG